ncbi:MAG: hypothetical protein IJV06_10490 [Bacteroidaceae bacterium]|nr:hypothetical protein [Bacteroidaceae bacterium]
METTDKPTYSPPTEPSSMASEPAMDTGWPDALEFFERHYNPNETVEDAMSWENFISDMDDFFEKLFNEKESRSIA